MRLAYITTLTADIPSFRYRQSIPGSLLRDLGHDVRFEAEYTGSDICFFAKHGRQKEYQFATQAIEDGRRVVFDVCDNHFTTEVQGGLVRQHYFNMCALATDVTCPTPVMAEVIEKYTGRTATVIPDPWETNELSIKPFNGKRLWFGYPTTVGVETLLQSKLKGPIELVTKKMDPLWSFVRQYPYSVTITEYSQASILSAFQRNSIAVIPSINDERTLTKSHNRLLEALRGGLIVCAAPLPAYEPFRPYCYLSWNINEALSQVYDDPEKALEKTRAGQEFIRTRYSPESIAEQWETFLFH